MYGLSEVQGSGPKGLGSADRKHVKSFKTRNSCVLFSREYTESLHGSLVESGKAIAAFSLVRVS
jgi:hypothetical protein